MHHHAVFVGENAAYQSCCEEQQISYRLREPQECSDASLSKPVLNWGQRPDESFAQSYWWTCSAFYFSELGPVAYWSDQFMTLKSWSTEAIEVDRLGSGCWHVVLNHCSQWLRCFDWRSHSSYFGWGTFHFDKARIVISGRASVCWYLSALPSFYLSLACEGLSGSSRQSLSPLACRRLCGSAVRWGRGTMFRHPRCGFDSLGLCCYEEC